MPIERHRAIASLKALLRSHSADDIGRQLASKNGSRPHKVPSGCASSEEAVAARWRVLPAAGVARKELLDDDTARRAAAYARNVENFIGTVKIPVGVAGPIRVNGTHAQGDYYVPMATTEAALVASYSRGAQLISEAGGCAAVTINACMTRAPGFVFASLHEAGQFIGWALEVLPEIKRLADSTTRHGRLRDMRVSLEGNHVYLIFDFATGDAAGQNIVTIATDAICKFIVERSPVRPRRAFVEANLSGDKKASLLSFVAGRGRHVTVEVLLPRRLVEERLRASPEMMAAYWQMSAVGSVLSGTIGVHGHVANALAAVYLACGQDAACVAESAVGLLRIELADDGLYASLTLPNLIVGTVGGGTALPSQHACLELLGLAGAGHANALAEVCASIALAGELSIAGAMCAGEFAQAHQRLARGGAAPARGQKSHA